MLFPISKDNVFKATIYVMLLSATAHLLTCLLMAIRQNNPDLINMFNVIGLSQLFPALGHGALNCLLGILTVIAIGVGVYVLLQVHDHKQGRRKTR